MYTGQYVLKGFLTLHFQIEVTTDLLKMTEQKNCIK